ncbi:glycosyltransferase family 39 protein [Candidatus Woesearchaeota archaeon]|nr:glycosyltransferase family 39 protein [Candidatus Woesearchaeota archaeon]
MIEILYFIPIALFAYGLGSFLLKKVEFGFDLERYVFFTAMGLFCISYTTLFLGFMHLLYRWIFFTMVVVGLVIFSGRITKFINELLKKVTRLRIGHDLNSILHLALALLIVMNLIASLAPPWEIDTLAYHLSIPKTYIMNHGIDDIPYMFTDNFPLFTEMLFLFGHILKNGILSQIFSWFIGVLLVLAIYSFFSRHISAKSAIFPAIIFYAVPIVMQFTPAALVDISLALFVFLACYSFFMWFDNQKLSWLLIAGIFAGTAGSVKINGAVPMFILFLGIVYRYSFYERKLSIRKIFFSGMTFGIVMAAVMSPWLIRNYVWTGNPVYPALYNIFGGEYFSIEIYNEIFLKLYNYGMGDHSISGFMMAPIYFTFMAQKFGETLGYGPFFLALVPIALFFRRNKALNYSLVFTLLSFMLWFTYTQQLRLTIFLLPFLSLAAGFALDRIMEMKSKSIISVLMITYLVFASVLWAGVNGKLVKPGLLLESEDDFFNKISTDHTFHEFKYINSKVVNISTILLYNKPVYYYLDYPVISAKPTQLYLDIESFDSPDSLRKAILALNVSHIIEGVKSDYVYSEKAKSLFNGVFDNSTVIYSTEKVVFYKLQ